MTQTMRICNISIFFIISLLLLGSCSTDDPQSESKQVEATFMIKSRAFPEDGTDATDMELIKTWWIVFVDKTNVVVKVIERPSDESAAVQREEFTVKLDEGSYTVYAFANIGRTDFGNDITEGNQMPQLPTTWIKQPDTSAVPMTGKLEINITDGQNGFDIEVVRLWAKMSFSFTTDALQPVTVSKISIASAYTSAINLLPDYNSLGKAPALPHGTTCTTLEKNTDITISAGDQAVSSTFYLLESTAQNHPTGRYPISFELKYGEGAPHTVNALAYNLEYINRNDFVTIPVLITDWKVDLNVLFYPPIGGYPAVLLDSKDNEFYARFGSGGNFVIRPTVMSTSNEQVAWKDIDITLDTSDPDEILRKEPVLDEKTSEITGEIEDNKFGTAVVTLTIKVRTDALQHTIVRRFYIIRQN